MDIYTFEKTFFERLEEINEVLGENSDVRNDFKNFIEAIIEPCMWNAIWRIPKASCEALDIKFPTEVFGIVKNVEFDDLRTVFEVIGVQDDSIHLPETNWVPLEELFPTKAQEEKCLNVELTADIIDRWRFFKNYIWMPWDEDSDEDHVKWSIKNVEPRLKLYYDLKNKSMSKGMCSRIRNLIQEARYIQKKKENLEQTIHEDTDVEDESMLCEDQNSLPKLMAFHLRLSKLKQEFEFLVNPDMRKVYENLEGLNRTSKGDKKYFVIGSAGTLDDQISFLEDLKKKIPKNAKVQLTAKFQDALSKSDEGDEIYIPTGQHSTNFLEYLNGNIMISGCRPYSDSSILDAGDIVRKYSVITSDDNESLLLAIDGDTIIQNMVIDCENVKTGLLIKQGNVVLKNCLIHGDFKSSISEGFSISGDSTVTVDNCVIRNFALGFAVHDTSKLILKNSFVTNCRNSLQSNEESEIILDNSSIINSEEYAFTKLVNDVDSEKMFVFKDLENSCLEKMNISLSGNCKFEGNKKGDAVIYNLSYGCCETSSFFELEEEF